jgi:putative phosphoesterase
MKIAITADIHGNSWALRSVLADIKAKSITEIYDLGDSLYGPLDPQGTFELICMNGIKSIRGNQDRDIIQSVNGEFANPTLKYISQVLSQEAKTWLAELKMIRTIDQKVFLCHGTPQQDNEYLIEQLYPERVGIKDFDILFPYISMIKERIIVCGHSHCPRLLELHNKMIINPGSVGLPAYSDDRPVPHRMENFSPKARYCILDLNNGCDVGHIAVSYDHETAAGQAEKNNRRDWAKWLRTGIA